MSVKQITKAEFVSLLHDVDANEKGWTAKHQKPIIVDFYATWCGPCKALAPILEDLATQYADRIDVYKVDVDNDEDLTAQYNIRTVPTLLFAKPTDSKPTLMLGVMGQEELREKIETLLLS